MTFSNDELIGLQELITKLNEDRAWLLEQIDKGRWKEFRIELASLERDLGNLLIRLSEKIESDFP